MFHQESLKNFNWHFQNLPNGSLSSSDLTIEPSYTTCGYGSKQLYTNNKHLEHIAHCKVVYSHPKRHACGAMTHYACYVGAGFCMH